MSAVVQPDSSLLPTSVVDVEALLAPIPGANPAGESLRYAGPYDEIRRARRADEESGQGEWKKSVTKASDWKLVVELATEALAGQTKDLQVCAWLTEGLVKLHGFRGLSDGLAVMRGLHERFWDCVHPEIDEDGLEARANSLAWLSIQLARAIKEVPVTDSPTSPNYSHIQWNDSGEFDIPENLDALDSDELGRVEELKERARLEGKITSEEWRRAKNATTRDFYEQTNAVLNRCREELRALDRVMDERFARETPGLGELDKSLDGICTLVEKLVKEKRALEPDPATPGGAAADGEPSDSFPATGRAGAVATAGRLQTRQDAFQRLVEVADYFSRTEPHSPVSYLVRRAVKWGQMPLEAWLGDVIKEAGALDQLRETLGLKTSDHSSDD